MCICFVVTFVFGFRGWVAGEVLVPEFLGESFGSNCKIPETGVKMGGLVSDLMLSYQGPDLFIADVSYIKRGEKVFIL